MTGVLYYEVLEDTDNKDLEHRYSMYGGTYLSFGVENEDGSIKRIVVEARMIKEEDNLVVIEYKYIVINGDHAAKSEIFGIKLENLNILVEASKAEKDKFEFVEKEKIYNNKKLVLSEDYPLNKFMKANHTMSQKIYVINDLDEFIR